MVQRPPEVPEHSGVWVQTGTLRSTPRIHGLPSWAKEGIRTPQVGASHDNPMEMLSRFLLTYR